MRRHPRGNNFYFREVRSGNEDKRPKTIRGLLLQTNIIQLYAGRQKNPKRNTAAIEQGRLTSASCTVDIYGRMHFAFDDLDHCLRHLASIAPARLASMRSLGFVYNNWLQSLLRTLWSDSTSEDVAALIALLNWNLTPGRGFNGAAEGGSNVRSACYDICFDIEVYLLVGREVPLNVHVGMAKFL
ncbi:hypothetical protein F4680DRAFT_452848 [Xylaria scruposa]|nr:hypothetical protein F4680DRAFT_452848 [Xylaria scruposa]